jgi:hypothetical protein
MKSCWREVPKIDFHVHIVLHERENTDLTLNTSEMMLEAMEENNVERAVVLPINYPDYFPLTDDERKDWLCANNERQAGLMEQGQGRLIAFADCALDGPYLQEDAGAVELTRAIEELGLRGLKVHPSNLKVSADDPRLRPYLLAAERLGVPIVFHANPSAYDPDFYGATPGRVYRAMYGLSDRFVVAHLGGAAFIEILSGRGYVDLSGGLLQICELFGVEFAERLLRRIGLERLLFATDYPIFPYERYFQILDRMNFSDEEIEQIAYHNAEVLLEGSKQGGGSER